MRLTAELVGRSPAYVSPLKDRELDLRGNMIPVIENLGAAQDSFDSIDLSNNEITRLENFPLMRRLRQLLLINNRVSKIASWGLGESLPELEFLFLTNNHIRELAEIDGLSSLVNLRILSLSGNMVTRQPNYRLYVINRIPSLRVLDFCKVKMKEREAAERLFGVFTPHIGESPAGVSSGSSSGLATSNGTFDPKEMVSTIPIDRRLTKSQIGLIKSAIAAATTSEEISRYEDALVTGIIPKELLEKQENAAGAESMEAD